MDILGAATVSIQVVSLGPVDRLKEKLRGVEELDAWAAVAILLREEEGDYETLLVKRAEVTSDPWSGDMAFPGGKKSSQDITLRDTVAREVQEETGINLASLTYIGSLPVTFSSLKPGRDVLPIVYLYDGRPEIRLNPELTDYKWVHFKELRESRTTAIVKGWEGPVFKIDGEIVWGLTYRMLDKLLDLIGETFQGLS
jgi:8-oxo-dGTP pyrophosphatase MutT (NUDIX family)